MKRHMWFDAVIREAEFVAYAVASDLLFGQPVNIVMRLLKSPCCPLVARDVSAHLMQWKMTRSVQLEVW